MYFIIRYNRGKIHSHVKFIAPLFFRRLFKINTSAGKFNATLRLTILAGYLAQFSAAMFAFLTGLLLWKLDAAVKTNDVIISGPLASPASSRR